MSDEAIKARMASGEDVLVLHWINADIEARRKKGEDIVYQGKWTYLEKEEK